MFSLPYLFWRCLALVSESVGRSLKTDQSTSCNTDGAGPKTWQTGENVNRNCGEVGSFGVFRSLKTLELRV